MQLACNPETRAETPPRSAVPAEMDWIETVGRVIADLELLNHNTEDDFLRVGGKLAEFIDAVNLISSELASLARSISGADGANAYDALTGALDHSLAMEDRHTSRSSSLHDMLADLGQLRHALSGYEGTVATFRAIGFLTRIEIARLGNAAADFGNLTRDVKLLAENVESKVQNALNAADALIPAIEKGTQDVSSLNDEQAKDLPTLISARLRPTSRHSAKYKRGHTPHRFGLSRVASVAIRRTIPPVNLDPWRVGDMNAETASVRSGPDRPVWVFAV